MDDTDDSFDSLVYVYPLQALISLFVHLLLYPERASADSDIEALYTVSGHLNFVEFTCADLEFPFAREVTNLARMSVCKARERSGATASRILPPQPAETGVNRDERAPGELYSESVLPTLADVSLLHSRHGASRTMYG